MNLLAVTVGQLVDLVGLEPAQIIGSKDVHIGQPGTIEGVPAGGFSFCKWEDERGKGMVQSSPASVVVVPRGADDTWRRKDQTLLCSSNPRKTFIQALPFVVQVPTPPPGVHPTATVAASARIHPSASIGAFAVIGDDCEVGPDVVLHSNVVLRRNVRIGARTTIFSGAVLGSDGFGYERDDDGSILKFLHVGGVWIGEDVEIGANTCVDRGTLGDTVIEDSARVDNLVHVAHNVRIGKRAFVIALTMIGGSTIIDDDAWVAPGAVLRNGITIGQRATVGLGAVVTKPVEPDQVVMGNPAKPRSQGQ